ncbi:MAG: nitroreductase [Desulfobulbaceae bacterium S5133MH15]|nr:MAG: nitroreductase [Desulfobulbaceae bacterium S5133MH15]OEU79140.1 MAG: nitroreductase [Desulfobulbaceae bacterium C00003063]
MTDIIKERRSIRRFTDQAVEQEKLDEIIEAARWAPSWGNLQCCEIVIVQKAEKKKKLAELLSAKNPASKVMENGPLVIAVCGRPEKSGYYKGKQQTRYQHWFMYDLGIVSQNICLKAHELGLGSVMVGSFDHPKVEALLNVPAGCELVALIPIGYPDHSPSPPKRKEVEDFVHYDKF